VTEHQVVAIVPARAGSKGIPRKNLQVLAGRSLLQWTVDLALSMSEIDRCIVSTDGTEIAQEARRLGAEVHHRPPSLAEDDSLVIDAIRSVLAEFCIEKTNSICVLLEPTSPFRVSDDITRCLDGLRQGAQSAATFSSASLHPQRAFSIDSSDAQPYIDGAVPWRPRQRLMPPAYQLTGHVYAFWRDALPPSGDAVLFGRIHPVIVPLERTVDIDEPHDLELADVLLRRHELANLGSTAAS
jgi:CMP-N,N'-diacetyllegionaminic acid synthase